MTQTKIALSIRQPWAFLVANGFKDIENREWGTGFRGPLLIHAGKTMTKDDYAACASFLGRMKETAWYLPAYYSLLKQCGGIVGEAKMIGCVTYHSSPWFVGKYGFVLRDAKPLRFTPCKGKLGFFRPELPQ